MNSHDNGVTYFARTNYRNIYDLFGIKRLDRLYHMYVIGKTGAGKSNLLLTLILQDIRNGEGITVIDPHGDLVEQIAKSIPEHRQKDVIYFNVPDPKQPYGYNPLKHVAADKRSLAASGILEAFHKLWGEKAWGQRLEYILCNALLAMLDQPQADLTDLLRLLRDATYRKQVIQNIRNEPVKDFWVHEYPKYASRYRAEAIAPIQSKIAAFLADPILCRVLTTPEQPLHLRKIMDEGKILLVNLAKGRLGDHVHLPARHGRAERVEAGGRRSRPLAPLTPSSTWVETTSQPCLSATCRSSTSWLSTVCPSVLTLA